MEVGKVKYYVNVYTETGLSIDITNAVSELGWEENKDELSTRISFQMHNASYNGKKLSTLIKINQLVCIKAAFDGSTKTIVWGSIKEAELITSMAEDTYDITAYDCLYSMSKSQDSVYFTHGQKTKTLLKTIFSSWEIGIDQYSGANIRHSKICYKNKSLSDIVIGILNEAHAQGDCKSVIRASGYDKVSILHEGSNSTVYTLTSKNCVESKYKISITDMVTRIKIMSSGSDDSASQVELTVNRNTEYGVIQNIITRSTNDTLAKARTEAITTLKESAVPTVTRTIEAPDVPDIHKGDRVNISAGSINGTYIVRSIQHNAADCTMSLDIYEFTE